MTPWNALQVAMGSEAARCSWADLADSATTPDCTAEPASARREIAYARIDRHHPETLVSGRIKRLTRTFRGDSRYGPIAIRVYRTSVRVRSYRTRMEAVGPTQESPARARWDAWGRMLSAATDGGAVHDLLSRIAEDLVACLGSGVPVAAMGVEVVRLPMNGRVGAIHDRWNRKAVLVDDREGPARQAEIVAHEVCHLLLGYLNRAGAVHLPRETQERLCDDFALRVTLALAGNASGALLNTRPSGDDHEPATWPLSVPGDTTLGPMANASAGRHTGDLGGGG